VFQAEDKRGLPKARVRLAEESERRGLAELGDSKAKDTLREAVEKRAGHYAAARDWPSERATATRRPAGKLWSRPVGAVG